MKYLKLKFKNGGFFEENSKQNVSISVNQISNVLHVLLGERPRPSYRETKVNIPIIPEIFEMANQSFIKIDTPLTLQIGKTKYNKKMFYPREIIHTNKNVKNSYKDKEKSYITWEILKVFLGDDLYSETLNCFRSVLDYNFENDTAIKTFDKIIKIMSSKDSVIYINNLVEEDQKKKKNNKSKNNGDKIENFSFVKQIIELDDNNDKLISLCKKLIIEKKTPLVKLLFGFEKDTAINKISDLRILATNIRGIESNFRKINGELLIPLTDNGFKKLKTGMGVSSILDGGIVWIDDVLNSEDMTLDELDSYIKINDLEEYENNFKIQ